DVLFHRGRAVQDDRVDRAAVSELGLERGVRRGVDRPRRDARDAVADLQHVVHRVRRRPRPDGLRGGAPDVRRRRQEGFERVRLETERTEMKHEYYNVLVGAAGLVAIMLMTASAPQARKDDSVEKKVKEANSQSQKAAKAFDAIMQDPDKAIPHDLIARAKAIAVFPQVLKVAFLGGGEGGRGVVSRHTGGTWGQPVFIRGGGASVGAQIGASMTDFFLLLMTDESVEGLMKSKFELGAEVGAVAGPVGPNHGAATDAQMNAQILSYARSKGLFAGVNVKGVVLRPEDDLNQAVYGKTAHDLLGATGAGDSTSSGLASFPQTLSRYAASSSEDR